MSFYVIGKAIQFLLNLILILGTAKDISNGEKDESKKRNN
jgi:hypothetical protein